MTGVQTCALPISSEDVKKETIDGEDYYIFQPNTIVYAIPVDSKLGKTISSAQMGIVFHTSYTGKSIDDMKASFNIDISNLKPTKDVWFRDASFIDASGTATFTKEETKKVSSLISTAETTFKSTNSLVLNRISANEQILTLVKTFNNTKIRAGEDIENTSKHVNDLIRWVEERYNKDILAAKKEDTKKKRIAEKNELIRFFRLNAAELKKIFDIQNAINDTKKMIIKKLQQMKQVTGTFLKTDDGFKITNPEGFVVVDKLKGNALKLVDRLEFSHANFNAAKNWSK